MPMILNQGGQLHHPIAEAKLPTVASRSSIMLTQDYVDTIASFPLFAPVPRAELEWMAARADVDRHAADTTESGPGAVIGAMPFSRMRTAPARLAVEEDTTLCALSRSYFAELVRECPELTSALVHQLLDRSRDFRTAEMHDDRMLSLGRLAAGLAHELNNPASGATSHARSLGASVADLEIASRALARAHLTDEQIECVDALRRMCTDAASTLTRAKTTLPPHGEGARTTAKFPRPSNWSST